MPITELRNVQTKSRKTDVKKEFPCNIFVFMKLACRFSFQFPVLEPRPVGYWVEYGGKIKIHEKITESQKSLITSEECELVSAYVIILYAATATDTSYFCT
jgi:hypothetical protein